MKPIRFATVLFMLGASVAVANASVATWSSYTATTATGDFGGVTITATTNSDAAFVGIANNHFGAFDGACGSWDGMLPLTHADEGLVASHVNGGDAQNFSFSSPLTEGLFYIENFDSSSEAKITVHGATHVALVDHSASITYSTISGNMGTLITSNRGFNGEGDAVLYFQGDVTGIDIEYTDGLGANGVFYTFAEASAVPEPTSLLVMAGLFGAGSLAYIRRKK